MFHGIRKIKRMQYNSSYALCIAYTYMFHMLYNFSLIFSLMALTKIIDHFITTIMKRVQSFRVAKYNELSKMHRSLATKYIGNYILI